MDAALQPHGCEWLDAVVVWGPAYVEEFIKAQIPDEEWLIENWCEGAVLLDTVQRRLVWFGGEDIMFDAAELDIFLRLMSTTWVGWTVTWASEGLGNIVDELGVSRSLVRWGDRDKTEPRRCKDPLWGPTLITVAKRGELAATSTISDIRQVLVRGAAWLTDFAATSVEQPADIEHVPCAGVHLDVDHQVLDWWHSRPSMDISSTVTEAFGDWDCRAHGRDWTAHKNLTTRWLRWPDIDFRQRAQRRASALVATGGRLYDNPTGRVVDALNTLAQEQGQPGLRFEATLKSGSHLQGTVLSEVTRRHIIQRALDQCGWSAQQE
jgi:hypothetical protein